MKIRNQLTCSSYYLNLCYLVLFCLFSTIEAQEQGHPMLNLTKTGVEKIRNELGKVPLFDKTLKRVKEEVDAEIALGIDVPIPKDLSGGYTHQRHKLNFITLQKAGVLYQILSDEKYATYIRDMLFAYEAMYEKLTVHPQQRSYARGKLFWQCLNDANWLVYTSQAYDCIYSWLSEKERTQLENNLFRPFADFLSIENPQFYNRIHNHSTWGNVAVGMIGLVMDDQELIERALYGIQGDSLNTTAKDNDGGFIKVKGQNAGFLANLDEPFSPDGYYTEGPYYHRYAMYPFILFAQALQNVRPDLKIFEYKNGVLLKSVYSLLQLTDANGYFFALNDAQKGMSYHNQSLLKAVNVAYFYGGKDSELLSIAEKQQHVVLDDAGLSVAIDIRDQKATPFLKKSILLTDGPDGKQGGLSLLRYGNEELTAVFKFTAQGLSHGHYDKLSFSLYEKGNEILQDYGMARFVNIGQKGGGNYLKENKSWAKQTIAHNTVIQNQTSHFQGKYDIGSKHHSQLHFYDISNPELQVISSKENNAYPGTELQRTIAMIKEKDFEKPFVLDIIKVNAQEKNQYDLPYYHHGQIIHTNFVYETLESPKVLGTSHGYQHLWKEAQGKPTDENIKFTWLHQNRFYSLTSVAGESDQLIFTRIGANDPSFNLRRDAGIMIRKNKTQNTVFAAIIEPHGSYNPVTELAKNSNSSIAKISIEYDDPLYTAIGIESENHTKKIFIVSNKDASGTEHTLQIHNITYTWIGPYYYYNLITNN